jgi:CAAD domains of cyanobacterial aminoacyl-tRNA synthetase
MEPEVKPDTNSSDMMTEEVTVNINTEDSATLTRISSESSASERWRHVVDRASALLSDLPNYVGGFFGNYKKPLITIGLVFGAIIAVKLTLALLDAVNDIPALPSFFELIGFTYSIWFIYRYLLQASTRRELVDDFNALSERILGKNVTEK